MVVGGKMRNQTLKLMLTCTMLLGLPVLALADGGSWGNYRGVERHDHRAPTTTYHYKDQYGRSMSQEILQYVRNISDHIQVILAFWLSSLSELSKLSTLPKSRISLSTTKWPDNYL